MPTFIFVPFFPPLFFSLFQLLQCNAHQPAYAYIQIHSRPLAWPWPSPATFPQVRSARRGDAETAVYRPASLAGNERSRATTQSLLVGAANTETTPRNASTSRCKAPPPPPPLAKRSRPSAERLTGETARTEGEWVCSAEWISSIVVQDSLIRTGTQECGSIIDQALQDNLPRWGCRCQWTRRFSSSGSVFAHRFGNQPWLSRLHQFLRRLPRDPRQPLPYPRRRRRRRVTMEQQKRRPWATTASKPPSCRRRLYHR